MSELTHGSVQQLLEVLGHVQRNHKRGVPLPTSYHDAVRDVKNHHGVTYQTIGDFRRRLGLADIDAYMALVERWLRGDADPLRDTIKKHSTPRARASIDQFFRDGVSATSVIVASGAAQDRGPLAVYAAQAQPRLEELRLRVPQELAQRLSLAHMARLGPTREDTALALLQAGFEAKIAAIRRFLDTTVGAA